MANMYNQNAMAQLGLQTGVTQGQAGVNTNLANNQSALGNALSGVYGTDASNRVALQGGLTSGGMSANNTQAAGEAAGAKNLLGAGLSLAGMVAGMPAGSLFGGGSGAVPNAGGLTSLGGAAGPQPLQQPGLFNRLFA
jgi:hypothetical protein